MSSDKIKPRPSRGRKRKWTHQPLSFLQDWQLALEEWAPTLHEHLTMVQVSNCGRVRCRESQYYPNMFEDRPQILDSHERPAVFLGGKYYNVARLVAETHIVKRRLTRSDVVDHIDGNAKNNWCDNLKVLDKSTHSAIANSVGRNNDIWTREQIGHIKHYLKEGVPVKELQTLYGGSLASFYAILRGKSHRFTLPTGPDPEKDLFIGLHK